MNKINRTAWLIAGLMAICGGGHAQNNVSGMTEPLEVVKIIGDKLIRETPFEYKLTLNVDRKLLNGMQLVDFGRTFGLGRSAVAYAYTHLDAPEDMVFRMQFDHSDGCRVWLNGDVVYEKSGDRKSSIVRDERSVELPEEIVLNLKKGTNSLLIKSETRGGEWKVCMQSLPARGALPDNTKVYPAIGLGSVKNVDAKVAGVSNWLVVGPFANESDASGRRRGLDTVYQPEKEVRFGRMYRGADLPVTWTIPRVEVLGDLIDKKIWGTNYTWNYHNGGVAWAMQRIAELSGEKKYRDYANDFCDFHLDGMPFVEYQMTVLNAVNSANNQIINTPLLDFTLAPALPFIYRLRTDGNFDGREQYEAFIDRMLRYARYEQVRLPESNIYTRVTPKKYTTWVDDMFMGIPFMIQASQYVTDKEAKEFFMEDAARQVLGFMDQVWDPEAGLYMHARVFGSQARTAHWSRANGWAIWAMSDVLMNLPRSSRYYKPILEQYRRHVESLVKLQDKSGFWLNVLDHPESPAEVSGTAIFTMAIARGITHGWLNAKKYTPVAMRGWDAIKTEVEPDGTVHKICVGTMCTEDINYYLNRPLFDNDTHGLFAVMFAGMEMHNLLNRKR